MLAKLNATVMCKNKGQTRFHITASMTCYKRAPAALVRSSILQVAKLHVLSKRSKPQEKLNRYRIVETTSAILTRLDIVLQ